MFIGKRRPVSMPVKPATLAWRRHSSRLTSSDSSARSSFHQAMGAIPSFAFMVHHTPTRCFARISSCCLRALRTASREETSGTPTSQSASPGTQEYASEAIESTVVRSLPFAHSSAADKVGEALATPCSRAHRLGVLGEINVKRIVAISNATIGQQIVEAWHAFGLLQPIDHGEPTIVADHNDHLVTAQDCRIDVRVLAIAWPQPRRPRSPCRRNRTQGRRCSAP